IPNAVVVVETAGTMVLCNCLEDFGVRPIQIVCGLFQQGSKDRALNRTVGELASRRQSNSAIFPNTTAGARRAIHDLVAQAEVKSAARRIGFVVQAQLVEKARQMVALAVIEGEWLVNL